MPEGITTARLDHLIAIAPCDNAEQVIAGWEAEREQGPRVYDYTPRPLRRRPRATWTHTTPNGDRIKVKADRIRDMTRRRWTRTTPDGSEESLLPDLDGHEFPTTTLDIGDYVHVEPDWSEVDDGRAPAGALAMWHAEKRNAEWRAANTPKRR